MLSERNGLYWNKQKAGKVEGNPMRWLSRQIVVVIQRDEKGLSLLSKRGPWPA